MSNVKRCTRCGVEKSKSDFHIDRRRPDGIYPYCKICRHEYYGNNPRRYAKVLGFLDGFKVVERERYPYILCANGGMRVHRYIIEKRVGRPLNKNEVVHHVDGNKQNWSDDNLQLMDDRSHRQLESKKTCKKFGYYTIIKKCTTCGLGKKYSSSYKNDNVYQCITCYRRSGGGTGRHKSKLLSSLKPNE